jgi:hypothetical protein
MRHKLILPLTLLLTTAAAIAETTAPDSQLTQSMLAEVRQLRNDLQIAAATIQRVQIVMYRLYAQATVLDRATQRLEQARSRCRIAQSQRSAVTNEIEQTERSASDPRKNEMLTNLMAAAGTLAAEEQQCQAEKADAETQLRTEQAKMTDLQDQLDKLDRILAGLGSK